MNPICEGVQEGHVASNVLQCGLSVEQGGANEISRLAKGATSCAVLHMVVGVLLRNKDKGVGVVRLEGTAVPLGEGETLFRLGESSQSETSRCGNNVTQGVEFLLDDGLLEVLQGDDGSSNLGDFLCQKSLLPVLDGDDRSGDRNGSLLLQEDGLETGGDHSVRSAASCGSSRKVSPA